MNKFILLVICFFMLYGVVLGQVDFGDGPIDVVVGVDTSKSVKNLPTVKNVFDKWMENVLKPGDRVCIMTFANKPRKSSVFTVTDNNIKTIVSHLPVAPDSDGDYTDLSAAVMEGLWQLTAFYHDASGEKRSQYMIVVSDFINDPPPESPYYNQGETPYLKYKKAKDNCLHSYEKFKLDNVYLQAFSLSKPIDELDDGVSEKMDEWWANFLNSIPKEDENKTPSPLPTQIPTEVVNNTEAILEAFKKDYNDEISDLKLDIIPVNKDENWGNISDEGIKLMKEFECVNRHKNVILKDISFNSSIEGFNGKAGNVTVKCLNYGDNTIPLIKPGEKVKLSFEIDFPGIVSGKGFSEKLDGNVIFQLKGRTFPGDNYMGKSFNDFGLSNSEHSELFPSRDLKDKKSVNFYLMYHKKISPLMIIIPILAVIILLVLIYVVMQIMKSSKPVSVSLKMEGFLPIVHSFELRKYGSVDIAGGSFTTPDQFELPDFEGVAASIRRKGNGFIIVPDKGVIVTDTGETINTERSVKFGDYFVLRIERSKGGISDLSFEFMKGGTEPGIEEELGSILDDDGHMEGKVDTGDLL